MTKHLRVQTPHPNILAFYDGRVAGHRFAAGPNWVDDGAISYGIASYALVDGDEALVYDTHVSVAHARFIREALEDRGIKRTRVVLSHWHLDHVAGTEVFEDCEIIAGRRTAEHLASKKAAIEAGTLEGPPSIDPLILPTTTFDHRLALRIGGLDVELIAADIHSDDAVVLWLPQDRVLLAGDTLEDTVTYVVEPENFENHLRDLDALWALDPRRILPNHGDPEVIGSGGYAKSLVRATQQYIRVLMRSRDEPELRALPLKELIAGPLQAGWINYFPPYEEVHRCNLEKVAGAVTATP